jgi:hypothetical protein
MPRKKIGRGMPWWRQSGDEILTDFKLRSCFPPDRVSEGIGFMIILKALISKQYEDDEPDCCTITPTVAYLQSMTGLDRATMTAYLTRMANKNIIQDYSIDSEDKLPEDCECSIAIERIRDEVDEYRRQLANKKKKEKENMLSVVKKSNTKKDHGFKTDEEYYEYLSAQNMPKV